MRSDKILGWLALCAVLCASLGACHKGPPHGVTLTWKAPPATTGVVVSGYNVYRSTSAAGPFEKVASRVAGPPYEDRMVERGRTYFYVVTAVNEVGRESEYTARAQARVP